MSGLTDIITADLGSMSVLFTDLSSILAWGNQTITGTQSQLTENLEAADEEIIGEFDCVWVGVISDFESSTLPAVGTVVIVDGVKMHIASIVKHDGISVTFGLRRQDAR